MTLKDIAEGAPFDMAVVVRLLALKVALLTGEILPADALTMDASDAGATLDSAAPAKKGKPVKKEVEAE